MSSQFRVAVWTAVSSDAQATGEDKKSLQTQIEECKKTIASNGWHNTGLLYQMVGSRTKYLDLHAAIEEEQELASMLRDAQGGRFNLLVMYAFDRLRDLLQPVSRTLERSGIQVYSVTEPHVLSDPEFYRRYNNDSGTINRAIALMSQELKTNVLRRDYATKMPKRVTERGLPATHIPYGYHKPVGQGTNRSAIPVQDTELVKHVVKMKDMLLGGSSLAAIAEHLEAIHAPYPRHGKKWFPQTVKTILQNPFYSGVVRWGASRVEHDPYTGKSRRERRDVEPVTGQGKHQALWDEETQARIEHELKGRAYSYVGRRASQFSKLMHCGECGRVMWIQKNGPIFDHNYNIANPEKRIWRCQFSEHQGVTHEAAIEMVGIALSDELKHPKLLLPPTELPAVEIDTLDDLRARLKRLEDVYLDGTFTKEQYTSHSADLSAKIEAMQSKQADRIQAAAERQRFLEAMGGLVEMQSRVKEWLRTADGPDVNHVLRELLDAIEYQHERARVALKWKNV